MWKVFRMLMDQAGAEGAAGGGTGSEGSPGAEGAGAEGGAAGQDPANQGGDGTGERQLTLNVNGKLMKLSESEVIARAQRIENITEREQKISKQEKTLNQNVRKAEQIVAELEGKQASGQELTDGEEDALKAANERIESLEASDKQRTLEAAFAPIKTQYPDLNPNLVLDEFIKRVDSGDVDDNQKGFMSVAEDMNKAHSSSIEKKFEDFLNDPENPKVKAHNEKVRADYIANKKKYYNASGANGGAGGSGSSDKPIESIADAATRARREG